MLPQKSTRSILSQMDALATKAFWVADCSHGLPAPAAVPNRNVDKRFKSAAGALHPHVLIMRKNRRFSHKGRWVDGCILE